MTKAQQIYEQTEALIASGLTKAEAFKKLSSELDIPLGSLRGSYYLYSRKQSGGASRPRRRETTPEDAVASAISALERAVETIDREIQAAGQRAEEARAEFDALKASSTTRKQAIEEKIAALRG